MEDVIHIIRQKDEVRHIVLNEAVAFIPREMRDIVRVAGDEVIDPDHAVPFRQKAVGEMRAEETCGSGDNGYWTIGLTCKHTARTMHEARPETRAFYAPINALMYSAGS